MTSTPARSQELFRTDAYRTSFSAIVLAAVGDEIELDQTCFAPIGEAGPDGDSGLLAGRIVLGVRRRKDNSIVHRVGGDDVGSLVGHCVECTLDWDRRLRSMRVDTARHLVDLATRSTHDVRAIACIQTTAMSFQLDIATNSGRLQLSPIQDWLTAAVADDLPLHTTREKAPPYRTAIHLDGYGRRYSESLHVRSTGEVGIIEIELTDSVLRAEIS